MGKQLLLVNDLPGYGEVALSAMMPVLTHMGHHVYNLPTALVSNTLDYGRFEILDTTEYMKTPWGCGGLWALPLTPFLLDLWYRLPRRP